MTGEVEASIPGAVSLIATATGSVAATSAAGADEPAEPVAGAGALGDAAKATTAITATAATTAAAATRPRRGFSRAPSVSGGCGASVASGCGVLISSSFMSASRPSFLSGTGVPANILTAIVLFLARGVNPFLPMWCPNLSVSFHAKRHSPSRAAPLAENMGFECGQAKAVQPIAGAIYTSLLAKPAPSPISARCHSTCFLCADDSPHANPSFSHGVIAIHINTHERGREPAYVCVRREGTDIPSCLLLSLKKRTRTCLSRRSRRCALPTLAFPTP